MDDIIEYIKSRYDPICMIVYGSYADGTNGPDSDFDAMAVTSHGAPAHDTSFVDGTRLDLFVYPASHFDGDIDWDEIAQIYGGRVVLDREGLGERLTAGVAEYIRALPQKSREEIAESLAWCQKMLARAGRKDPEGMFRWHWLLVDSLEIYFDAIGEPYRGPKKALLQMERERPRAFELYSAALGSMSQEALGRWIEHIGDTAAESSDT